MKSTNNGKRRSLRRRPHQSRAARFESLEARRLLAGLPFNFTIDDPGGLFDPFPDFVDSLNAAGEILTGLISGQGSMEVRVIPNNADLAIARGGAEAVTTVGVEGGFFVVENGTISEARTGEDPNGTDADILLQFNTESYLPIVWFDPSGAARTAPIPDDKQDFVGTALHELVHALGFQGFRTIVGASYGEFTIEFPAASGTFLQTTYDVLTEFGTGDDADILFFEGPAAMAEYGGPVPLTSLGPGDTTGENFFHVGNPEGEVGDDLIPDLMNGVVSFFGVKYDPSGLDLAILADLGLNTSGASWHNAALPADVTGDGSVTINDLLALISDLRINGVPHVLDAPPEPPPFLDVDDDGSAGISDILAVIAVLRALQGGGEGELLTTPPLNLLESVNSAPINVGVLFPVALESAELPAARVQTGAIANTTSDSAPDRRLESPRTEGFPARSSRDIADPLRRFSRRPTRPAPTDLDDWLTIIAKDVFTVGDGA